jgi:hypothetical protein
MNYKIAKPCKKEVYDLTTGKTLSDTIGNFCGRIKADASAKEISFKKLLWRQNPVKYILFTSLLLFTRNIKAQLLNKTDTSFEGNTNQNRVDTLTKTITVSGFLTDKKTKETIPFANVAVYDNLNNQLGVATTDINGVYKIKLDQAVIKGKTISVKAVYIGYEPTMIKDIPLNSIKQNIYISLSAGAVLMGDVMVVEPIEPVKPTNKTKDDLFNSEYDTKRITPDMERDQLKKKPR